MVFALLLGLTALSSGTLATYCYDRDAPFPARLCAGAATGWAALALVGFVTASVLGMTALTLVVSGVLVGLPLALLLKAEWRALALGDMSEAARDVRRGLSGRDGRTTAVVWFYALAVLLLWLVFGRAMYVRGGEVFTGAETNLGDLPFHISIITGFAFGDNFPPEHPEFSGVRLTYPFMVDFLTAMFVRAGASLQGAMFWQNFVLAVSLTGLLHRWAWKLTRDALAARLVPVIVLLSGGLGWLMLFSEWRAGGDLFEMLSGLAHNYTITSDGSYRWGNALTVLLIPQRGLLLGLPLALLAWTLWWKVVGEDGASDDVAAVGGTPGEKGKRAKGSKKKARRRFEETDARKSEARAHVAAASSTISAQATAARSFLPLRPFSAAAMMAAAGVAVGLLPLVHAHSYVVMMAMGGCLALLFPKWWREWGLFLAIAVVLAVPQMLWATRGSAARAGTFFGWEFGWDHGEQNVLLFWLKNTGAFIPLLVAALAWRSSPPSTTAAASKLVSKRLLLFYAPFTLCFVIPNLTKLSPWVWDNIKVILYWWIASAPLVALLLANWWRGRNAAWRAGAALAFLSLVLAGGLDVWRVVSEAQEQKIFDRDGGVLADLIKRETPARSLILHAPTYNHPVFLTGRRSPMGYAGHLWTHGLDYAPREADLRRMYAGAPAAAAETLLRQYGVDYVVVSPLERAAMPVNEQFFEQRYTKVGEVGAYRLYKTARP